MNNSLVSVIIHNYNHVRFPDELIHAQESSIPMSQVVTQEEAETIVGVLNKFR